MDKLILRNIELFAAIGVSDAEREVGQWLLVNVEVGYDLARAGQSDDVADTISYSEVARIVYQVGTTLQCRLLEFMAQAMCEAILEHFPAWEVRIQLLKRPPPTETPMEAAGVEIVRRRDA